MELYSRVPFLSVGAPAQAHRPLPSTPVFTQSKRTFVDMRLKANAKNDEGITAEQEAAAALAKSRTALSETASVDGDGAQDEGAKAGALPRPTVSYVEYVDAQLPAKGRYEIVGMSQFEPWFIRLVTAVQVRCDRSLTFSNKDSSLVLRRFNLSPPTTAPYSSLS